MAKQNSKVSDETIIAALIQHGTVKAAAEAAGVSTRTVYDRMQTRAFVALYEAAKNDLIRQAVFSINSKLSAAIDAVSDIMTNEENNPAVRLQAAQTIINNAAKFAERLTGEEYQQREKERGSNFLNFDSDF